MSLAQFLGTKQTGKCQPCCCPPQERKDTVGRTHLRQRVPSVAWTEESVKFSVRKLWCSSVWVIVLEARICVCVHTHVCWSNSYLRGEPEGWGMYLHLMVRRYWKRSWTWNTKPYIRLSCCQFCAKACWLVLLKPMEHQRLNNSDVGVRCLKNKQGSRLTLRLLFKWLCHQWLWGKSPHVPFTTFCLSASLQTTATDVYLPMVFPMHILVLKSHAFCTKRF